MSVALAIMTNAPPEATAHAIASAEPYVDRIVLVIAPGAHHCVPDRRPRPTKVVELEWAGYAQTRTATLGIAEQDDRTSWVLMLDSYSTITGTMPPLDSDADAFEISIEDVASGWRWLRAGHLTRARKGFSWRGSGEQGLHEALAVPPGRTLRAWPGLVLRGSPSPKAAGAPRDYSKDATALEQALAANPTCARTAYYLACSYKDAGLLEQAYAAFERRAVMSGFAEEDFWARWWLANLAFRLGRPKKEIVDRHMAAHEHSPDRAEPLTSMAAVLRAWGDEAKAIRFALEASRKPYPKDARLFVSTQCYSKRALEEASVAA
jgi:tetratricopeptide (TPR) repeat protein